MSKELEPRGIAVGTDLKQGESVSVDPSAIMKGAMVEVSQLLEPGQVVGDPMTIGEVTIIPLVSIGFGFGAGGGGGGGSKAQEAGQGGGGGGGGGGGVRPLAVIIIDKGGARLEAIPEAPSGLDRLGNAIGAVLEKRDEKRDEKSDR